jgi:GPH family glycoside/pentoside/hexuronide:cation symporter
VSIGDDFALLLKNKPWWLLIGAALCSNLFNTVRGATVAYFFADIIGADVSLSFMGMAFLFYAGLFLGIGEVSNMAGVALCVPIANKLGKKTTFIIVNALLLVFSVLFFFIPMQPGYMWLMITVVVLTSIGVGLYSPLLWSMYADVADYATEKNGTSSTGLIFSSGTMAQKLGGAVSGSLIALLLGVAGATMIEDAMGNTTIDPASVTDSVKNMIWMLFSIFPAIMSGLMILLLKLYPIKK